MFIPTSSIRQTVKKAILQRKEPLSHEMVSTFGCRTGSKKFAIFNTF